MRPVLGTPWFEPKRWGYGATPSTWQGWLATMVFVALMAADVALLRGPLRWACGAALTAGFVALACAKTNGTLRWQWGRDRGVRPG